MADADQGTPEFKDNRPLNKLQQQNRAKAHRLEQYGVDLGDIVSAARANALVAVLRAKGLLDDDDVAQMTLAFETELNNSLTDVEIKLQQAVAERAKQPGSGAHGLALPGRGLIVPGR